MALFAHLIQKWKAAKTDNKMADHPLAPMVREHILRVWIDNERSHGFSEQETEEIASRMLKECIETLTSSSPFLINRVRLAATVLDLAEYLVLTMDPAPSPDPTGIRGGEVTGELKSRLEKLGRVKNHLRIWTDNNTSKVSSYESLCDLLMSKYKIQDAKTELFLSLDHTLVTQTENTSESEWFRPFLYSMCASKEHYLRMDLKMPSVLDPDPERAELLAMEHSLFFNLVRHGLENPLEAWTSIVDHIEYEDDKMAVYSLYLNEYPV